MVRAMDRREPTSARATHTPRSARRSYSAPGGIRAARPSPSSAWFSAPPPPNPNPVDFSGPRPVSYDMDEVRWPVGLRDTGCTVGFAGRSHPFGLPPAKQQQVVGWSARMQEHHRAAAAFDPLQTGVQRPRPMAGLFDKRPEPMADLFQREGMAVRDAQRRQMHARQTVKRSAGYLPEAQELLERYAAVHAGVLRPDGSSVSPAMTMPMTGMAANWREYLKKDARYARASVPPSNMSGHLPVGRRASTRLPDGTFHMVRTFTPGHVGYARFARGVPPGYSGFVPAHVREGTEEQRANHIKFFTSRGAVVPGTSSTSRDATTASTSPSPATSAAQLAAHRSRGSRTPRTRTPRTPRALRTSTPRREARANQKQGAP